MVLTGKMPFRQITKQKMEGGYLRFKDGTEKYMFDSMYTNLWQIKLHLEQVTNVKKSHSGKEIPTEELETIEYPHEKEFKENQFFTWNGILLVGVIFCSLFMQKGSFSPLFRLAIILAGLYGYYFISWKMHFFVINKDSFIVRNSYLIWKERVYPVSEVKEVVFESMENVPYCLRIITKNYKTKLYPACTLKYEKWKEMEKFLQGMNIHVRNDNDFLDPL